MHVGRGKIVVGGVCTEACPPVPFVHKPWFDGDVEHLLLLSVVHARDFSQLALLLVCLDFIHRLGRQEGGEFIVCHVASIDLEVHFLLIEVYLAFLDADSGELLQQSGYAVAIVEVERLGVEDHGVALHDEAFGLALHHNLLEELRHHLQFYVAKVDGVLASCHIECLLKRLVAKVLQFVLHLRHGLDRDMEHAQAVGLSLVAKRIIIIYWYYEVLQLHIG